MFFTAFTSFQNNDCDNAPGTLSSANYPLRRHVCILIVLLERMYCRTRVILNPNHRTGLRFCSDCSSRSLFSASGQLSALVLENALSVAKYLRIDPPTGTSVSQKYLSYWTPTKSPRDGASFFCHGASFRSFLLCSRTVGRTGTSSSGNCSL